MSFFESSGQFSFVVSFLNVEENKHTREKTWRKDITVQLADTSVAGVSGAEDEDGETAGDRTGLNETMRFHAVWAPSGT